MLDRISPRETSDLGSRIQEPLLDLRSQLHREPECQVLRCLSGECRCCSDGDVADCGVPAVDGFGNFTGQRPEL